MKVGIDLGTSYSLIARIHPDGSTSLIPDATDEERVHTPSSVIVTRGGAFVGAIAEDMVEDQPDLPIIRFFKRRLGERDPIYFDDRGVGWHPEAIAALLLDKLRFDAERATSKRVEGAVITVPAHFTDPQRRAVAAAAMLADLPLLGLIEEPVAATLHYGVSTGAERKVLLAYDFGGGTFDATVMSLDQNGVYVLGKSGLTDLGGKELDEKIGEAILEQFTRALGHEPELTARTLLELRRASERIKIELCTPGTRRVRETVILRADAVEVTLEASRFEESIAPLVERTVEVTLDCLREAGLDAGDVDTALLVGGSSMVPAVERRLKELFSGPGQEVLFHQPSRAVALGAAMRAAQLAGEAAEYRLPRELKGVTGYTVGVRTVDSRSGVSAVDPLIKKNMPLPASATKTYYTTRSDQRHVVLDFVQYRRDQDLIPVGRLKIGPLPNPQTNYPIQVRVEYREDGTIDVVASDSVSGQEIEQSFGGESTEDVQYFAAQRKLLQSVLKARP